MFLLSHNEMNAVAAVCRSISKMKSDETIMLMYDLPGPNVIPTHTVFLFPGSHGHMYVLSSVYKNVIDGESNNNNESNNNDSCEAKETRRCYTLSR